MIQASKTRSIIVLGSPCPQHHFELQPQLHDNQPVWYREGEKGGGSQ